MDTHKLFCGCSSDLAEEEPISEVERKLRAVAGELGEVDRAAQHEYLRDRSFLYQVYDGKSCLVELDEEPPMPLNQEALDIGLQVSLMLHTRVPDEIHVMRKTVIDGSNTCGFQRTAMIGLDGWMEGPKGRVEILTVCLEEEAAGIAGDRDSSVVYRLDRLGIPLVEIATGLLVGYTPQEVQDIARKLGMMLRMTGRVQRGIGTIRQDVNVSIREGARVEIKGFQEIGKLGELIENEARRQEALVDIRNQLSSKGAEVGPRRKVTEHFRDAPKGFVSRAVSKGSSVLGIKLTGFAGVLGQEIGPGRTFGRELADHAKAYGLGGVIHSDEDLEKMGLQESFSSLAQELGAGDKDALVIVVGRGEKVENAMEAVRKRCKVAMEGVPEETREPNPDFTTSYKRPLPGSSRMYPETDIPPIPISRERLEDVAQRLPESPSAKREKLTALAMSSDLADQLIRDRNLALFEKVRSKVDIDATLLATTLVNTFRSLRRDGVPVDDIPERDLVKFFSRVNEGDIVKERIEGVLRRMCEGESLQEILKAEESVSEQELRKMVDHIVEEKSDLIQNMGDRSFGPVMGLVMKRVRGKIDGAVVGRVVKQAISERLEEE